MDTIKSLVSSTTDLEHFKQTLPCCRTLHYTLLTVQDYPNYKYRPRRKKRDGQKGGGGAAAGNNNNKTNSNNNNLSNGAVAGAGADKEEEEAKYEVGVASSETPPLYEVGGGVAGGGAVGRSFTIPTPESSPSSCTSDAFHGQAVVGYQPITSSAPPINIEGELAWLQLVFETHLYPVTRIPVLMRNETLSPNIALIPLPCVQDCGRRSTRCPRRRCRRLRPRPGPWPTTTPTTPRT